MTAFSSLFCAAVAREFCVGSVSVFGGDFVNSFRVSLAKDHLADSECDVWADLEGSLCMGFFNGRVDLRLSCWAIRTQWGYGEDVLEVIESMSRLVEIGDKAGGQALMLQ